MICFYVNDGRPQRWQTHRVLQGTKKRMSFVPSGIYPVNEEVSRYDLPDTVRFEAINMHILDAYAKRGLRGLLQPAHQRYEMALRMEDHLKLVPEVRLLRWTNRADPGHYVRSAESIFELLVASRLYANINKIAVQFPDFVLPDTKLEEACRTAARFHGAVLAGDTVDDIRRELISYEMTCVCVDKEGAIRHIRCIIEVEKQNRMLAIAMGQHARLGQRSPLRGMPSELLQKVCDEDVEEDDEDWSVPTMSDMQPCSIS